MRDVSERRKELEKEQTETLATLRDTQNELQWRSNCSAAEKVKICETIEALQVRVDCIPQLSFALGIRIKSFPHVGHFWPKANRKFSRVPDVLYGSFPNPKSV